MVIFEEAASSWEENSNGAAICSDCIENLCGCDSEGGSCDTADWNCPNDL